MFLRVFFHETNTCPLCPGRVFIRGRIAASRIEHEAHEYDFISVFIRARCGNSGIYTTACMPACRSIQSVEADRATDRYVFLLRYTTHQKAHTHAKKAKRSIQRQNTWDDLRLQMATTCFCKAVVRRDGVGSLYRRGNSWKNKRHDT